MSFPLVDLLTIPSEMSSLPVMYDLPKRDTGRGETGDRHRTGMRQA